MVNYSEIERQEIRRNVRVGDNRELIWHLQNSDLKGQGRIRNISTSGMLLETNGLFIPNNRCTFLFSTSLGIDNYVPKQGRVIWTKKKTEKENKYLCGVQFSEPAGFILAKLHRRVEQGIKKVKLGKLSKQISNFLFSFLILGLTGVVIWLSGSIYQDMVVANHQLIKTSSQQAALTRNYVSLYQQTQQKLQGALAQLTVTRNLYRQSRVELTEVTKELEATKAILSETELMLAQAKQNQADTTGLNEAELQKTRAELMNTVALLEEKNEQLLGEMGLINEKIAYYEGNIQSATEGKSLIRDYRLKLKNVKSKIRHFVKEAKLARVSALSEQDRIRLILGNNGFFIKDGQRIQVDEEKFNSATLDSAEGKTVSGNDVKIDVTFVD